MVACIALTIQNFSVKIEYQRITAIRYTLTSSELLDTLVTVFFMLIFSEVGSRFKLSDPIYSAKTTDVHHRKFFIRNSTDSQSRIGTLHVDNNYPRSIVMGQSRSL